MNWSLRDAKIFISIASVILLCVVLLALVAHTVLGINSGTVISIVIPTIIATIGIMGYLREKGPRQTDGLDEVENSSNLWTWYNLKTDEKVHYESPEDMLNDQMQDLARINGYEVVNVHNHGDMWSIDIKNPDGDSRNSGKFRELVQCLDSTRGLSGPADASDIRVYYPENFD